MQSRSYESRSSGADAENSGHLSDHSQGVEEDSEECGIGIKVSQFKGRYEVTEMAPGGPASQTGQIFVGEAAQRPAACRHASAQPQFRWPRTRTLRAPGPRKHGPMRRGVSPCVQVYSNVQAPAHMHCALAYCASACICMCARACRVLKYTNTRARTHTHAQAIASCRLTASASSARSRKR